MAIELRNVVHRVGAQTHIYETSLSLEPGGFNILLGTTSSGKTTLMRLMAGLERPATGEIWFNGENVTGVPVQRRNVAMVYQAFINYPSFTVFDNIASPLKVAGVAKSEINERVHHLAELLKLTPMLQRLPSELSGGQQQRTALARALVKGAELVLLDEPLANLDYKLREELRDELPKLFTDSGATVVYATSEPMEALLLGGHTATLSAGRVVQFGETAATYRNPVSLESARVFSEPPINTATVDKRGNRIYLSEAVSWDLPPRLGAIPDGPYTIGIRPYHLVPNGKGTEVMAEVQIAELSGSQSIVRLTVEGNNWVSESRGMHPYAVGERAVFSFDPDRCLYFDADENLVAGSKNANSDHPERVS